MWLWFAFGTLHSLPQAWGFLSFNIGLNMNCCKLVLLFSFLLRCATTADVVHADSPSGSLTAEVERVIFEKTNQFRLKHDLPVLSKDAELTKAAAGFAAFMAKSGKYGHRADGQTPAERAKAAGYNYCVVRENIAYRTNTGDVTADSLVKVFVPGWIDSPPHRENMLAEHITGTGIGVATTDRVTYYAVVMFGRPESAKINLKITNESGATQTLVVEAGGDSQEIEMPPRGVVSLTECFPTTLSMAGKDFKLTVAESASLVVTTKAIEAQDE